MTTACTEVFAMVGGGQVAGQPRVLRQAGSDFHECGLDRHPRLRHLAREEPSPTARSSRSRTRPTEAPSCGWATSRSCTPTRPSRWSMVYGELPAMETIKNADRGHHRGRGRRARRSPRLPGHRADRLDPRRPAGDRHRARRIYWSVSRRTSANLRQEPPREGVGRHPWSRPTSTTRSRRHRRRRQARRAPSSAPSSTPSRRPTSGRRCSSTWTSLEEYVGRREDRGCWACRASRPGCCSPPRPTRAARRTTACSTASACSAGRGDVDDWTAGGLHAPTDPGPRAVPPGVRHAPAGRRRRRVRAATTRRSAARTTTRTGSAARGRRSGRGAGQRGPRRGQSGPAHLTASTAGLGTSIRRGRARRLGSRHPGPTRPLTRRHGDDALTVDKFLTFTIGGLSPRRRSTPSRRQWPGGDLHDLGHLQLRPRRLRDDGGLHLLAGARRPGACRRGRRSSWWCS